MMMTKFSCGFRKAQTCWKWLQVLTVETRHTFPCCGGSSPMAEGLVLYLFQRPTCQGSGMKGS